MANTIPDVLIKFAVGGQQDVSRACDSIEARLLRMEKAGIAENERATRTRVRGADTETKERERAYAKLEKEMARYEAQQTREAERQGKARERLQIRSSEMAGRYAKQQADLEIRERERVAKEDERQQERMMRIRIRSSEMAGRMAAAEAREEIAARERVTRAISKSVTGSIGGLVGGVGSMAAGVLGIGGGFALANIASNAMSAQSTASLIRNVVTAGNGGVSPDGSSVANIVATATAASKETNVDRGDILQGAFEYARKAKGGDIAGVLGNMSFIAKMSKITGASTTDIAGAAGTLQSQNPDLKPADMQQMLLDVYAQSAKGSLGMIDVAKQMGVMASQRGAFVGDVATNQRKLLALGQLAAPEGSPEEAGTYVKDFVIEAGKHRKQLEPMGVQYKNGQFASPEQLIDSVFRGTGGDLSKIEKLFGARGTPIFSALLNPYRAAGGGEAGVAAVNKSLADVTGATMTPDAINKALAEQLEEPGEKFKKVLNELSLDIEGKLIPWMPRLAADAEKMLPAFESMIDKGAELAEWFASNPFSGIGSIVALAITKDLSGAAIGSVVESSLKTSIGRIAGSGFTIAAATIAVTEVGMMVIDLLSAMDTKERKHAIDTTDTGANVALELRNRARTGKVTPEDIANAQKKLTELRHQEVDEKNRAKSFDLGAVAGVFGDMDGINRDKGELANTAQAIKMLKDAIVAATPAIQKLGGAAGNTSPNNPALHAPIDQRPSH